MLQFNPIKSALERGPESASVNEIQVRYDHYRKEGKNVLTKRKQTISESQFHVTVTEPTETSKPRGKQCRFSLDVSIGKEILARSIGHLERNNLPIWDDFEKLLWTKTQSDAPQVTDTLQYRLKAYAVTITPTIPKEVVGPITIRGIHNWDTIVEEVQRMTTTSKPSRDISFRVQAEYQSLSQLVPAASGPAFSLVGTQETLTQLVTTKRKVFQSYSALD